MLSTVIAHPRIRWANQAGVDPNRTHDPGPKRNIGLVSPAKHHVDIYTLYINNYIYIYIYIYMYIYVYYTIIHPLVNFDITMENHHAINGKTHYSYGHVQ